MRYLILTILALGFAAQAQAQESHIWLTCDVYEEGHVCMMLPLAPSRPEAGPPAPMPKATITRFRENDVRVRADGRIVALIDDEVRAARPENPVLAASRERRAEEARELEAAAAEYGQYRSQRKADIRNSIAQAKRQGRLYWENKRAEEAAEKARWDAQADAAIAATRQEDGWRGGYQASLQLELEKVAARTEQP